MDEPIAPANPEAVPFATSFYNVLHRVKNLLFSYWWIIILTIGLGLGIQWLLLRHVPLSFVSTGRMIVNVKLSIPNANLYSEELNNFFGTQVALMESDSVINRVKHRLQSENPPLEPLPVNIKVVVAPKTSIFTLTATGPDANYTQVYLEATMEEFINLKRELLANASTTTKFGLADELTHLEAELKKSNVELLDFQSSNSVVFLQQNGGNSAADYLADLTRQRAEHISELQLLQTLNLDENLERRQSAPQTPAPRNQPSNPTQQNSAQPANSNSHNGSPNPADAGNGNNSSEIPANLSGFEAAYLQVKQQIVLLKAQRDDLSQFLRPKHPDIVDLDDKIASAEKLLATYREQSQQQLKNRQHTIALQIEDLTKQINEWETKTVDVSKKLSDFDVLKENHRRLQTMYDQLLATMQTLDVDKGFGQESVTTLEPASTAQPVPQENVKHMIMGGLIGLVAGFGILFFLNRLDDRPGSITELEKIFDEMILGQIPLVKAKSRKIGVPILQLDDDRHILVEAYRNLRSAFIFKDSPERHAKNVVITSAIPNDGKSMTTTNFAITLAQAGSRVLLVDADLRRGVIHNFFSVAASPGFSEVLAEQCSWSQAVVQTSIPNLDILPNGKPPRHPGALFGTKSKKFMQDIAGKYDYCLFDTAPVMAADDVSNLAPHADGLIMIVRAGYTSGRVAKAALDLLYLRKINVIGLVFNAVQPSASEYYYYRYKEYYAENLNEEK